MEAGDINRRSTKISVCAMRSRLNPHELSLHFKSAIGGYVEMMSRVIWQPTILLLRAYFMFKWVGAFYTKAYISWIFSFNKYGKFGPASKESNTVPRYDMRSFGHTDRLHLRWRGARRQQRAGNSIPYVYYPLGVLHILKIIRLRCCYSDWRGVCRPPESSHLVGFLLSIHFE